MFDYKTTKGNMSMSEQDILSHLLLNDENVGTQIADTPAWKDENSLTMDIKINGADVSAQAFRLLLGSMWEQSQVDSGKRAFEQAVVEKAEQLMQEKADDILSTMSSLQEKLEDVDSILKFRWED